MVRLVADGFGFLEAPVATLVAAEPAVLAADMTRGGVFRIGLDGSVTPVVTSQTAIGGMCLHADGRLVLSSRRSLSIVDGRAEAEGVRVVLDRQPGDVAFNDLIADGQGRMYVGALGHDPRRSDPTGAEPGRLYLVDVDATVRVVDADILLPNGLALSADGRWLWASDSGRRLVFRYRVDVTTGLLHDRSVFAEVDTGQPDGLAASADGGLWVATADGGTVIVFDADGRRHSEFAVPGDYVTNLCFGPDGSPTLFVTTGSLAPDSRNGAVYTVHTSTSGVPVPHARTVVS